MNTVIRAIGRQVPSSVAAGSLISASAAVHPFPVPSGPRHRAAEARDAGTPRRCFATGADHAAVASHSQAALSTPAQPASGQGSRERQNERTNESASNSDDAPASSSFGRVLSTLALIPVVFVFFTNVLSVRGVRGSSMQPTLNPHAVRGSPHASEMPDDVVLVWKLGMQLYKYQRGQVVVLISPTNPKQRTTKRLVGVEGDFITDKHNPSLITRVPRGHVWVEGDNELTSVDDSRQLGPIPLGLLCGRVTHVIWPPSRIGRVQTTLDPAGGDCRIHRSIDFVFGGGSRQPVQQVAPE